MSVERTDQLFLHLDGLERAKFALVFLVYFAALVNVFCGAAAQPDALSCAVLRFDCQLDDASQPKIRTAICFIVIVNAGYFTPMFLKDIY